ncbi:hypothetical protein [Rossellomorea sp. NRS-1567]|uniref:hypothetical protein n=1 Tax=Rossellomorea sp. NRS-1567 TaxID=3233901 RepID=UPI003D284064
MKICQENSVKDGEGELRRLLRKYGRAETPEAKLRRLGRTSAESGAVPLTIQHKLVDRALADTILENNNLYEKNLMKKLSLSDSSYNMVHLKNRIFL